MSPAHALNKWRERKAIALVILLFLTPLTGFISNIENDTFADKEVISYTSSNPWDSIAQPWGQYSRVPTHNGTMPPHGPDGGPL